jgi:hypothetical protein
MTSSQWTFATGLRNTFIHLAFWSLPAIAVWMGIASLMFWLPSSLGGRIHGFIIIISAGLAGLIAGWILSRRVSDAAGFNGPILLVLCMTGVAIVDGVGIGSAALLAGAPIASTWFMSGVFFIAAAGVLIVTLWSDM